MSYVSDLSQIDVPPEVSNKAAKTAENFLKDRGKDPHNTNLFDEAQYAVFKEMISYWAAFTRRYQDPGESNPRLPCKFTIKLTLSCHKLGILQKT